MTECEEEIESLNSNLDSKNEFISALQMDNTNKREETEYLVNQLQKSNNVVKWDLILTNIFNFIVDNNFIIRIMEREILSVKAKQSKRKVGYRWNIISQLKYFLFSDQISSIKDKERWNGIKQQWNY